MSHSGRFSKYLTVAAGLASLVGLGCTGTIAGGGSGSDDPGVTPGSGGKSGGNGKGGSGMVGTGTGGDTAIPPVPGEPGPATFRRLSHLEYNNTVHDLLGDT